jgi:hypothetical protein
MKSEVSSEGAMFSLKEKGQTHASNERVTPARANKSVAPLVIVFLRPDILTWKR